MIALGPDRRVTYWNTGAEALYGWKAEEVVGRSDATPGGRSGAPQGARGGHRLDTNGHWSRWRQLRGCRIRSPCKRRNPRRCGGF
ncbi:MAG: PAS domain-containing protein [Solirubrobacteraceae bacterium]